MLERQPLDLIPVFPRVRIIGDVLTLKKKGGNKDYHLQLSLLISVKVTLLRKWMKTK